ncbi:hypothetical protein NDU88_003531 [Pleurodeles waltl]|uniref:Uncharacterized protein n=1 Tax=Pleurodeles waltl TaxID=8319 RepID=A0AAV7ME29_PLEWA|nr:hypothetical protein NDU88_003531 [Pleurodeles waltl]
MSRSSAALPPDGAYLHPGPQAPAGTSAAAGGLVRSPPLFSGRPPPNRVCPRLNARPQLQPRVRAAGLHPHGRARSTRQHTVGSPRGPDHARYRPPVQHLCADPDRPGKGVFFLVFQPAPPERENQACAISGFLATPTSIQTSLASIFLPTLT